MTTSNSFRDCLVHALQSAADYNKNDMVAPAVILWPDEEQEWAEIVPHLRKDIPILTLGPYDREQLTGPAIWIRYMLAKTLPEAKWTDDVTPVVYLPGYSRSRLRTVEECPSEIKPLAGLQYRGVIWSQKNNWDWTLAAFLQNHTGGLGIQVSSDSATIQALRRASVALLDEPVDRLKTNAPLKAEFFNELLTPDIMRQVLLWMENPETEKSRLSPAEWAAFRDQCRRELDLDPEKDGEITAAKKLGSGCGKWAQVWQRFKESPTTYPNIPELLRKAKPQELTYEAQEPWPQDNEHEEELLRTSLISLAKKRRRRCVRK